MPNNIVLSERSQIHKIRCVVIHVKHPEQFHEDRKWICGGQGWGGGVTANRQGASFWKDENFLELGRGDGSLTL